jgi:deferrochelatase/peroxidase EfeB
VFVDPAAVPSYPKPPVKQPDGSYNQPGFDFPADLRQPPTAEPPWATGGTYMVVRGSVINMANWDQQTFGTQETAIGRFKFSGAPLDRVDEASQLDTEPDFTTDQDDVRVALNAHIRKANPRRSPEDAERRFFRRGYPLITSTISALELGLVFVCFGRSISTQFEFAFRAWMRNPNFPTAGVGPDLFLAFESAVLAGGYYFVPPLQDPNKPWSWVLPI